jgi:hypothetical protein
MEQINSSPTHNLIPEKEANFSPKDNVFFNHFLAEFEDIFAESYHEFSEWEDETLIITLNQKNIRLTKLDFHKLLAFKNTNWEEISITTPLEFRNLALLINGEVPITDSLDPIDPAYVAWAIEVMERQDANNEIEITDDVAAYVALCFHEDGFLHMPKRLEVFNEYLYSMNANDPVKDEANDKIKRVNEYLVKKRSELD